MFWGLIMEPTKRYMQEVKKAFHISMACIDVESCTEDPVQVMCVYDNRKYLLCTLHKGHVLQCPLDLNFDVGMRVAFVTNGDSHVHLTGYLIQDEDLFEDMMGEEEEDDEIADVSLGNISSSNIVSGKRSKSGKVEGELNGLTAKVGKKLAALSKDAPPAKKLKTMDLLQELQDEDDEDDSDVDLSDLIAEGDDDDTMLDDEEDDDNDDDDEEEEEDDDEEEEDDEEIQSGPSDDDDEDLEQEDEDEEDSDEEGSEEEKVVKVQMPQQNGATKKSKKELTAEKKKQEESKSPKLDKKLQKSPQKKSIEGGVIIEETRQGAGPVAKPGKMVQVYYEGRLKSNNKVFDSATKGVGFKFRLGRGEVIKGWDVGISGMKVGGKRRLICPPAMAYGQKGSPPTIPPNSTLIFDVEVKNVH